MKRLLNFIYGLLLLCFAVGVFYEFKKTEQWYSWLYLIPFIGLVQYGLEKIEKACK